MNPDDHITGTFDPNNPANQNELELSEIELLKEQLADANRVAKYCRELVKQMQWIENSQNFQIAGTDEQTEKEYINLRERLYYKIKHNL